jgi:hypothetical protein
LGNRIKINMHVRSLGIVGIIYISGLVGTLAVPATAQTQTVTVDMSGNLGAPTYRASGFLYGLSVDGTLPAADLLNPLKPQMERGGGVFSAGKGGWSGGDSPLIRQDSHLSWRNIIGCTLWGQPMKFWSAISGELTARSLLADYGQATTEIGHHLTVFSYNLPVMLRPIR